MLPTGSQVLVGGPLLGLLPRPQINAVKFGVFIGAYLRATSSVCPPPCGGLAVTSRNPQFLAN